MLGKLLSSRKPPVEIVLGSKSSARREILEAIGKEQGFSFQVATADIDEKKIRHPDPRRLVLMLGHAKARAILAQRQERTAGLLITGDQVCVHDGQIREKPESEAEARAFIRGYGESAPKTVSSVVVTDEATGRSWEGVDEAEILFQPLPAGVVDALIAEGDIFHCAGGLLIEHPLVQPHVLEIRGTQDSVMGLPKAMVLRLLGEALEGKDLQ